MVIFFFNSFLLREEFKQTLATLGKRFPCFLIQTLWCPLREKVLKIKCTHSPGWEPKKRLQNMTCGTSHRLLYCSITEHEWWPFKTQHHLDPQMGSVLALWFNEYLQRDSLFPQEELSTFKLLLNMIDPMLHATTVQANIDLNNFLYCLWMKHFNVSCT